MRPLRARSLRRLPVAAHDVRCAAPRPGHHHRSQPAPHWPSGAAATRRPWGRAGGRGAGGVGAGVARRAGGGGTRLRDPALDGGGATAPASVVDAYAGVGDTALALARDATVTAIELDASAV